jgi:hypothetical protein
MCDFYSRSSNNKSGRVRKEGKSREAQLTVAQDHRETILIFRDGQDATKDKDLASRNDETANL